MENGPASLCRHTGRLQILEYPAAVLSGNRLSRDAVISGENVEDHWRERVFVRAGWERNIV